MLISSIVVPWRIPLIFSTPRIKLFLIMGPVYCSVLPRSLFLQRSESSRWDCHTILDFLAFNLVLLLTGNPVLSRGIGYVFGTLWAFFVNRSWVFKSQNGISSIFPFLALYGSSGFVAVTIQSLLNESSGVFIAYLCSLVGASVMNFLGMRFLVFRRS